MWQDGNRIDVFEFVGCSDDAANTYCYELNLDEKRIFQEAFILFYRSCLHIAVVGYAVCLSLENNWILDQWMRDVEDTNIRVCCGTLYFSAQKVEGRRGFEVSEIGRYC